MEKEKVSVLKENVACKLSGNEISFFVVSPDGSKVREQVKVDKNLGTLTERLIGMGVAQPKVNAGRNL